MVITPRGGDITMGHTDVASYRIRDTWRSKWTHGIQWIVSLRVPRFTAHTENIDYHRKPDKGNRMAVSLFILLVILCLVHREKIRPAA